MRRGHEEKHNQKKKQDEVDVEPKKMMMTMEDGETRRKLEIAEDAMRKLHSRNKELEGLLRLSREGPSGAGAVDIAVLEQIHRQEVAEMEHRLEETRRALVDAKAESARLALSNTTLRSDYQKLAELKVSKVGSNEVLNRIVMRLKRGDLEREAEARAYMEQLQALESQQCDWWVERDFSRRQLRSCSRRSELSHLSSLRGSFLFHLYIFSYCHHDLRERSLPIAQSPRCRLCKVGRCRLGLPRLGYRKCSLFSYCHHHLLRRCS